jgi:hypothetical protein
MKLFDLINEMEECLNVEPPRAEQADIIESIIVQYATIMDLIIENAVIERLELQSTEVDLYCLKSFDEVTNGKLARLIYDLRHVEGNQEHYPIISKDNA